MLRRFIVLSSLLMLVGCAATVPPKPAPEPVAPPPQKAIEPLPSKESGITPEEMRELMAVSRLAQPTQPLNVRADCGFRDPKGYRGKLKLDVRKAEVRKLEAEVTIPPYGVCRFGLARFRQVAKLPNVHLIARDGNCAIRLWEQGKRTTVAFSDCPAQCSGAAFDYLWPIFVETRTGRCS